MNILGISAFYHDSAAAIISDGKIVAAAQEERFTRIKHDPGFPTNAVKYCLLYSGLSIGELDAVAFYDKPLLKFERLLETFYSNAPKGMGSFISSMPIWIKEKVYLKNLSGMNYTVLGNLKSQNLNFFFPSIIFHMQHPRSILHLLRTQPFLPLME